MKQDLKQAIELVALSASKRAIDGEATQLHFLNDCVQAHNADNLLCVPLLHFDKAFSVESTRLLHAMKACKYDFDLKYTPKSLIISKGKFRSVLPYTTTYEMYEQPEEDDENAYYTIESDFLEKLDALVNYVSTDASIEWSTGILVRDGYMYATNNIVALRVPTRIQNCVIPLGLVRMLLKLKECPQGVMVKKNVLCFTYASDAWLIGRLIQLEWPSIEHHFNKVKFNKLKKINKKFKKAVATLNTMSYKNRLCMTSSILSVDETTIEGMPYADFACDCSELAQVLIHFTHGDLNSYPAPFTFTDGNIDAIMAGVQ